MTRTNRISTAVLLVFSVAISSQACGQASEKIGAQASRLLPRSVVLFGEMESPADLAELVLTHPLRQRIESLPLYQAAWQEDGLVQLKAGVSLFEASMGERWPKVLEQVSAGGVCVAIDAQTEGLAVMIQASDVEILKRLRDTVFAAVRGNKPAGGQGDPIQVGQYRGVTGYGIRGNIRAAVLDKLLLITNEGELGKAIIDRYLDGPTGSLSESQLFTEAYSEKPASSTAWGFVDVEAIRSSGAAPELYGGMTDNFIAELLIGGILSNLKSTPISTAELLLTQDGLQIRVSVPHDLAWVGEDRAYYFGANGQAKAPDLIRLDHQLFALSAYRDMSQAWLRAGDLMTEKANDQLAQADTQLTTFFSGRDFGEDILGAIEPEIQLVAVQQDFEEILPRPAIKLPAFALQFQMRDPAETQPELRRVFQSFIGFLNVVGAMNGNPQFDLGMQSDERFQLVSATCVPDRDRREATDAAINFNFSPTIAFAGKQLIISSTTSLAESMVQRLLSEDKQVQASLSIPGNTVARLEAATLFEILEDNRNQLVAQNMLEKGHSRQEAEGEIDVLLTLLKLFQQASLKLSADQRELSLGLELKLAELE